jgi:hypothetical protein
MVPAEISAGTFLRKKSREYVADLPPWETKKTK